MEFRLLGPIEVTVDGCVVDAGRPRQRMALAALLAEAGRSVSPEALIDRVWGDAPPQGARRALHAYLTRIRRVLEHDGARPAPLVYRSAGYVLDIDPQTVDVHHFRRLCAAARNSHCDEAVRAQWLRQALQLWRGEPLAGLPGEWAARTRRSWSQERLDATIAWAQAELSIGNAETVIGPLTDLAAEHPLLEPLAVVLLRALHAAGRSATALDHYTVLRERLADQLGADPSAQVQAAHQAILRGDTQAVPPPPKAARTLPATVTELVGRHDELRRLLSVVDTAAIHAVDGMAGVGKTAFAIHAAHQLAARFPDGQQFIELRAHAPGQSPVDPAAALAVLLQADGVAAQQIPAGLDARTGLWRERMADKKLLLVLDDAADPAQVTPLLPAAPGCLVLITSRRKLGTLPGTAMLSLETLPPPDAVQLFRHRAGPRADHDLAAVRRIVELCGYLPLAINLIAARLHIHATWDVADLADDLAQARDRLGELASGDVAVAAAFELSYHDLSADTRRLFRRLGLHPGPDFDAYAAAALDRTSLAAARRGLEVLLEHNLLTEPHRGRYLFHDLIAEHARAHAETDPALESDAALSRLLTYYLHTATAAATCQDDGFGPIVNAGPADSARIDTAVIADSAQATRWFNAEQANLTAAAIHAATCRHPAAVGIPAALHEHLRSRGPWDLAVRLHHIALTAAQQTGDQLAEAQTLINVSHLLRLTSDYPAAATTAEQAHAFHEKLGDLTGQAAALNALALARYMTGEYPVAAVAAERACTLYQQVGDRRGQADALDTLARVRLLTGDYPATAGAAEQANSLHEMVGNRHGQANALLTIARVRITTGEFAAAAAAAEQAHSLHEEVGNRHGQALALQVLATVWHATGDHSAATATATHAHTLYQQVGNRHGQANAVQVLGLVHHATGDHPAAAIALEQALGLFREVGDPDGEAETLNHIGQLQLESATSDIAYQTFAAALGIAEHIGTPAHEARALEGIGHCLLHQHHRHNDGIGHLRAALTIYQRLNSRNAARVEEALHRHAQREK